MALADVLCYGPKNAKNALIYFHGLDQPSVGELERANRVKLKQIAEDLEIRIALPRTLGKTQDGSLLRWPQPQKNLMEAELGRVLAEATDCLKHQKNLGVLGFSNGGYFLGKVLQYRLSSNFKFYIGAGSAGEELAGDSDLSDAAPIYLLVGDSDSTLADTKKYFHYLESRSANVSMHVFSGGHELDLKALSNYLKQAY